MENENEVVEIEQAFCLRHGHYDVTFRDQANRVYHNHAQTLETPDGMSRTQELSVCYGPFTETPPPASLTETDWENLFLEEERAVESIWLF